MDRRGTGRWIAAAALGAVAICFGGGVRTHQAAAQSATLSVAGDVPKPQDVAAAAFKAMPRTQVEIKDEGRPVVYEGVLVSELLRQAGMSLGADLRGAALATYVLATASDGYQVLFSIAEMDPAMTGRPVIVADSVDGKPLVAYQGPFRLVVPGDSRPARWVRMLQRLDVVRVRK